MSDIIKLLPDSVANQIAAGEVVQRPSSVVKELMENSIDAGAGEVILIIKDAGKTLVQIIDNGSGMSATDSRMSFERHATSKIRKAEDLFSIKTMGFRGEAMASTASVAQVELKTKKTDDEIGTLIEVEGGKFVKQESIACQNGTSISVKNLFFNIPARRKFLKSDSSEFNHIDDEFKRVALSNPEIAFSLIKDGEEKYNLPKSNLKQRILHLLGKKLDSSLIKVEESSELVSIKGFVGIPSIAKKKRDDQFLFVNNRFIKSTLLHSSICNAYNELLQPGTHPFYVLFIEIDPDQIDVNIHPQKTEIKFEDERIIYSVMRSSIMRAIGKTNLSSIDFDVDKDMAEINNFIPNINEIKVPAVSFNPNYNPFSINNSDDSLISTPFDFEDKQSEVFSSKQNSNYSSNAGVYNSKKTTPANWDSLYEILNKEETIDRQKEIEQYSSKFNFESQETVSSSQDLAFQIHNKYIVSQVNSGLMVIDQQAASERILYEKYLSERTMLNIPSQQCLHPRTMDLSISDMDIVMSIILDLKHFGFEIRPFGKNTIIIDGIPCDVEQGQEILVLEKLIEDLKLLSLSDAQDDKLGSIALSLAKKNAIKAGVNLSDLEISTLLEQLFACDKSDISISGKPIYTIITLEELLKRFL